MATQTVVSDNSTACQEVEKEVKTESEKMEPEKVPPPKESVENPKLEELACPTPPSVESEVKNEEKKIETPVIEEIKEISVDEKPVAEATAEVSVPPLAESTEETIKDKSAESAAAGEKKIEDVPVAEAKNILEKEKETVFEPETASLLKEKETVFEPETTSILKPIIDTIECKSEEKTDTETAVKQEESKLEAVEDKLEDLIKKVVVPESSSVNVVEERLEKVEEVPAKEVEVIETKDVKVSETVCKAEDISESVPLVEEKPLKQSEAKEQTAKEPTVVEPAKDCEAETPVDKVEDSKLPTEVKVVKEETIAIGSSDKIKSDTPVIKVQEKDVECSAPDEVSEKTSKTTDEKEPAKKTDGEGPFEEKTVELGKREEKSVVGEESPEKCEDKPIEDVTSSVPPPKVSEKATDKEVTSKDIELVADNGKKDETVASSETTKDAEVDEKVEMEAEKIRTEETTTEEKIEEKAQATETKLEEEKEVHEAPKTDVQTQESTKDCEETKTLQDAPKADVPIKTQKQSNNIIKMMKHSLVKAKKAIVGKSQNSKSAAASEPKDDITK